MSKGQMGLRRSLFLVMLAVMMLALLAGCSVGYAGAKGAVPGKAAPEIRLNDLDGRTVSLSQFRGRPVLIDFWATWCQYCRAEMPYMQAVYDQYKDQSSLVLLSVNIQESAAQVQEFMKSNGYSFPVLLDTQGTAAGDYNVRGLPSHIFIGKDGIIKDVSSGAFPSKEALNSRIAKLLQ